MRLDNTRSRNMSTGTTDTDGIVASTEYTHDGYLVDEIDRVDLSDLQFDDDDDWLYVPSQCSIESTVDDIYTWLKTEPDINIRNNKKYIDTRTFTRPKKRSARMSFESIFEGLSPNAAVTNTLRLQNSDPMHTENGKHLPITIVDKESVPQILKPSVKTAMSILSNENSMISGHESMEAFLNMSQSKGIDSFINLGEPEFNDLLMNVSHPSILYTSVISSVHEPITKNDTILVTNKNIAQNSNDIEQTSKANSFNETFTRHSTDNMTTSDKTYCANFLNDTFSKESVQLDKGLNETYDAETPGEISALRSSLDKGETTDLSSTFVTEPKVDVTFVQLQNEAIDNVKPLDTTYLSSAKVSDRQDVLSRNDIRKITTDGNNIDLNVTRNIPLNGIEPYLETHAENTLNLSSKVPIYHQSTPINQNTLNPMFNFATKHLDQPRQTFAITKAPTMLRQELLAEIQRSERKLDSTYNHISDDGPDSRDAKENVHVAYNENNTDMPPSNRYHTYKKSTTIADQYKGQKESAVIAQKGLSTDQRKFYTFTKKNNNPIEKTDNNTNGNSETRLNMDGTFCKPLPPKMYQKRNIPRMLSKLPQFLQKSNPNLVSNSLKTASGMSSYTSISSVGYMKGSQPNIVQNIAERSLSKLHPYGKLKSGSEQRLLEVNVNANSQFPMKDVTAGSTESIESTQSIHSAPDLDDRLSTCSDSSSQCTRHTMNIQQLHQLVRMQEESLKQDSASKPNRQILENTWVEEKRNLPSPILKVQRSDMCGHSLNIDLSMKCSSPLMSPTGSSHALNNDRNPEGNVTNTADKVAVVEKTENRNQVMPKVENKTRLRQPTNWTSGSKPAAVISGIPRPASRIPAPKFVRPNTKIAQIDLRKGCT